MQKKYTNEFQVKSVEQGETTSRTLGIKAVNNGDTSSQKSILKLSLSNMIIMSQNILKVYKYMG